MTTNGVKEIIEKLKKIEGSNVWIHIGDKLYGDQNLKCAFHLFNDEERLGFSLGERYIYIEKHRICNIGIKGELLYFADDVMCIKIRKLN